MIVAIEGLDGSGKSTIVEKLSEMLMKERIEFILTTEPTNGPIGQLIRRYLNGEIMRRDLKVEALLFAADRIWHLSNVIGPAIKQGKIVVTDRYKYSSMAYQGLNGEMERWVEELNKFVPEADLAFFIDVNPRTCMFRIERTDRRKSVMENVEFLNRVYLRYLDMVRSGKLIRVDGRTSAREVAEKIFNEIKRRI